MSSKSLAHIPPVHWEASSVKGAPLSGSLMMTSRYLGARPPPTQTLTTPVGTGGLGMLPREEKGLEAVSTCPGKGGLLPWPDSLWMFFGQNDNLGGTRPRTAWCHPNRTLMLQPCSPPAVLPGLPVWLGPVILMPAHPCPWHRPRWRPQSPGRVGWCWVRWLDGPDGACACV